MIPDEFLQLANRLALSHSSGPAEFRTSIRRAYYAVFHLAREFLNHEMQFFCKNRENEHIWVQRHFANCATIDARDTGRIIQNMHEARKDADYELSDIGIERLATAKLSLERAEQIKALLASCASDANLPQIKVEMIRYRTAARVQ